MKSYDYAHRSGVKRITWNQFASLARNLAELVSPFHPQIILGIARAGLFPATVVACALRCELFPIRLTRRKNDEVLYDLPVWKVPVPQEVVGKVVVVIDEIADTGQTLSMAAQSAKVIGAKDIVTASLVSHSWADPAPQVSALVSDAFVIFPWDRQVFEDGKWIPHPEIMAGLNAKVGRSKNRGN
jgi:hypoxanthine phosphoribosyltransferase